MPAALPVTRMAWRNVRRNWRHSLAAMLSIVVGFLAMGLFDGYLDDLQRSQGDGFQHRYMFGDLIVEREGSSTALGREDPYSYSLSVEDQAFLDAWIAAHRDEVRQRVRFVNIRGLVSAGQGGAIFVGYGYDVEEGAKARGEWAWDAAAGKPLQESPPASVMVSRGLGSLLDCTPREGNPPFIGKDGAPIRAERPLDCRRRRIQVTGTTQSGQLNVVQPEVAGLLDPGIKELDSRLLVLPLPLAHRLLDTKVLSWVGLTLARPERAAALGADLRAAATLKGIPLSVRPWKEHPVGELYKRGMELLGIYRTLVVVVVVSIAGMSVLTTMMKSVTERIREIGTLRSIGFLRRHILALFGVEAALLALVSSAAGLAVTVGLTWALNHSGITYKAGVLTESIPLTIAWLPRAWIVAALFLSGVAAVAALVAARRAVRMKIPDALGHA